VFLEYFQGGPFADASGHDFSLAQANLSVSAAGVLRGIHFADVPPGQAKYVTCVAGAVVDVVLDLRVGSPTFGRSDQVVLDDVRRRGVFVEAGLGHGFMSVAPGSTVVYLCSTGYTPELDHGVHPLDPAIGIKWPTVARNGDRIEPILSAKDAAAPTLAEAAAAGILPTLEELDTHVS
jgi:dTDP-4-dehydrorhamnose 3,5-epimerase